ncbi:putative sulfate/molybdate transporter [Acetobacterium bakii]|uniref:Membrane protein n=1 Tax=Acetobacterium bakii TaxID=52689 RepID=A0A0L6TXD4_9FIRM|nr:putative sulfate/molybdate transporter [Acetobacterium bakii]KNZ40916.1 membrane protein [Acetobacterium bakii]
MKRRFHFNLRELAGSMGDFGTLFPLVVGYIAICGMDPVGLLITIGIANIATGIIYRLPMPIEPMKVIAITAIAQRWEPSLIYATGIATGMVWLVLSLSGIMDKLASVVPKSVVRGIQTGLGLLLAFEALKMMGVNWILGAAAFVIIILLKDNKYFPAALVLILGGIGIMVIQGDMADIAYRGLSLPQFQTVTLNEMWEGMVLAGFAQIPLTATNAVIATAALLKTYWPDSHVTEKQLSANMGIMNLVLPFMGGMPLCHGAGGLVGQYTFGARTGGTNIIEGSIEISLGIFLGSSIALLFGRFPMAIIGAMMFFVGYQMIFSGYKTFKEEITITDAISLVATAIAAVLINMAVGFLVGLAFYYFMKKMKWGQSSLH